MGTQNDGSVGRSCYDGASPDSSVVVYVMGKIAHHEQRGGQWHRCRARQRGWQAAGETRDFGLTGTNRVTTRPCTGGPNTLLLTPLADPRV